MSIDQAGGSGKKGLSLSLMKKMPGFIAGAAAAAAITTAAVAYLQASWSLEQAVEEKLVAVLDRQREGLVAYLDGIRSDLRAQAHSPLVRDAVDRFKESWDALGTDPTKTLHTLYIDNNPHPVGEKLKLNAASDGSDYSATHGRYHPWFREFLEERGYYDIFLIDPDGNLVYTVFKELDYATNLLSGPWADTDLARAFKAVQANPRADYQAFFDFQPYAPSNNAPASFIAAPILDEAGTLHGVLAFQMPIGRMNALMQTTAGLGETGETYLIGANKLMRSDSRFSETSTILKKRIDTAAAEAAVAGETGFMVGTDYRGIGVMSAYAPVDFLGTRWGILAEQDVAEATAAASALMSAMGLLLLVVLGVSGAVGLVLGLGIARPIQGMTRAMKELAAGSRTVTIPGQDRGDEIGAMAAAVQVFRDNAVKLDAMQAEQAEAERRQKEETKHAMHKLADEFEADVGAIVQSLSAAASQMQTVAQAMSRNAEETSSQSTAVASAAEQASANVQTVAAATEELASSIAEISRQMSVQSTAADNAVSSADDGETQIKGLAEKIETIGGVVTLIQSIASQTNLLALNATIEAARAGEAGKGFAVVANEVKGLANQTGTATKQIADQISSIHGQTDLAVRAIVDVTAKIDSIREISASVAAAIEQQNAAAAEIGRNTEEASVGTSQVTTAIASVTDASRRSGECANDVLAAAEELSRQSALLSRQVTGFIERVRTG